MRMIYMEINESRRINIRVAKYRVAPWYRRARRVTFLAHPAILYPLPNAIIQ